MSPRLLIFAFVCLMPSTFVMAESPDGVVEIEEDAITDFDRDHWSFRPLVRPLIPDRQSDSSPKNAVDHFIDTKLAEHNLATLGPADPATLLRRLKFDLLGLPPTVEEVLQFKTDHSEQAYKQLVDRFLASPRYGERWAQHWLDLARFAETDGFEHDKIRPNAWKYRDWVIDALNSDMPYDEFVQLQIAGDLLKPNEEQAKIATAFCLSGPDMPDVNSQAERRHNLLNEITGTVGASILGLQLGCAQCHDHKYDPISQADFYRIRAFFDSSVQVKRDRSVFTLMDSGKATTQFVMLRGDHRRPGAPIRPGFLRVADQRSPAPSKTSLDRAALAHWITRPDHPLTARVMVNRVWQHHFGRGLSSSSSDFGVMGEEPTHPQLLDWLATEFIRLEWSLKSLHRMIVTSATYRRASRTEIASDVRFVRLQQVDPNNELLGRFRRRRLEGEVVRDAMLAITDDLNLEPGGKGVMPPLPPELRSTLLTKQWNVAKDQAQHQRRSVFVFARRNLRYPIFDAFDRPDGNASCAKRDESTTATQSLLMLNSALSLETAEHLADLCLREGGETNSARAATLAFSRCYGRSPLTSEAKILEAFFDDGDDRHQSMTNLCLALLNANEFIYVD